MVMCVFYDGNSRRLKFFNIIKDKAQWIIYMMPILIFLPLFRSLVFVIKSLQSMIFSLEYEIIKYLYKSV